MPRQVDREGTFFLGNMAWMRGNTTYSFVMPERKMRIKEGNDAC